MKIVTVLTGVLLAGTAQAQTPFGFSGTGAPASSYAPLNAAGATKLDVTGPKTTTNGTSRVLANSDVVNVLDQGAKCDGSTDDTAAFNASFSAALAKSGGSAILVPAGRCIVSTTLALTVTGNKSINLRGEGRDVSEIVWSSASNGLTVTLSGSSFSYGRTPANPSPVFHMDGLSLVSARSDIGGTALTITSTATPNNNGFTPRIRLHDIGVHGTVNGSQGWHDGIAVSNLPSGITFDDGYIILANVAPPFNSVGNAIALRGGPEDANGCVAMVSSLYFLSNITIQNAGHGIDVGSGVQDVDMDRVGGNANWFLYVYQRAVCGATGSIRMANSNPSGYNGSVHIENTDNTWLTNNQPQPYQGSGSASYTAFDFLGSISTSGSPGNINITANQITGNASHGGNKWTGISINKAYDTVGAFNETVISANQISLLDAPVQVFNQARNVLLVGNTINNWLGTSPYVLALDGNYSVMNNLNGVMEGYNSVSSPLTFRSGIGFAGTVDMPNIAGSDPHSIGRLFFDASGVVHRSGG